jgi:LAS superfamily LD-carboxypeptidase LdcB
VLDKSSLDVSVVAGVGGIIFCMENKDIKRFLASIIPAGIVFFALGGFIIYEFMRISELTKNVGFLTTELASTTAMLVQNASQFSQNITDLSAKTSGLSNTLSSAQQNINDVKTQVGGVEQTVGSISGTVGTLQKLSQIDPELLKKYSKVFFMNENYVPAHLANISDNYLYSSLRSEQFLSEALPFLNSLFDSAKSQGIILYAKSAYRSFAEQQTLKSLYTVIYGAGTANSFSADQGYSEHQLGTTLDFITTGLGGQLGNGFDSTEAYKWLIDNAYRFGFELSYPKGNSYYVYEPWHWRFVGVKLATFLHDNKLNFYGVDQREIDAYLANIFD